MDSFEWNKVAGALIFGVLVFMLINIGLEPLFPNRDTEEKIGVDGSADQETEVLPTAVAMTIDEAMMDSSMPGGERSFRKCQACHTANEGGGHRVGPNLYDIMGNDIAAKDGYAYSEALSTKEGVWSYEEMDAFLASPSSAVPGTKMSFAGIRTIEERANIIAYLRMQSANPIPLPEVTEAAPEEGGEGEDAPAETAEQ